MDDLCMVPSVTIRGIKPHSLSRFFKDIAIRLKKRMTESFTESKYSQRLWAGAGKSYLQ